MQNSALPDCPTLTADQVHLPVYATSDVHAALLAYDYFCDQDTEAASLARVATLVRRLRATRPVGVLLDNGDVLQGTPMADAHVTGQDAAGHPVIAAMNHLGYDAAGLGNHEFNLAPQAVREVLGQAAFPILCANLDPVARADQPFADLWRDREMLQIATRDGAGRPVEIKVGVFGVVPPQVMQWDGLRLVGRLEARDMVAAARETAAKLVREGADIVIALAHTGINDAPYAVGMENAASHIAALGDVDVMIAGHVHRVFPGPQFAGVNGVDAQGGTVRGTASVMPGMAASHLGLLDLVLEQGDGRWRVRSHASHVLPSVGVPQDPEMVALLGPAHARTLAAMRETVGTLVAPAQSYFAMVEDDRSVRIVAEAMLAHVARDLAGSDMADLPVLASVAPMKCGGRSGGGHYTDVAAGPVAMRAIADLQVFDNHLSVLKIDGAGLVEWLEMSASLYNQLAPDVAGQVLFERDTPTYNREAIYGLSYDIDLSQPRRYNAEGQIVNDMARRVRDVVFRGAPLDLSQTFLLASNEYRAGGGGRYPASGIERTVPVAPVEIRQILIRHIRDTQGRVSADIPSWRLRRLPGVVAEFETGAGAAQVALPDNLALDPLGPGTDGFLRFRLDLGAVRE